MIGALRKCLAAGLTLASVTWPLSGQDIEPVRPHAPVVVRPYLAPEVPPVRIRNSDRFRELMRAGTLYLTVQDAIALALENNIDLEVSRYNPLLATWQVERAEAGGALPGVPSTASQAFSVASGQGVLGSQAAAGVSIAGAGGNNNRTVNASITQIGPVTQTLDPTVQETTSFAHTSNPQPDVVQSLTTNLISSTHVFTGSLQEGFLSGGGVSVNYNEHYLNENSPSDVLNPSVAPNVSVGAQHNLLRGFGVAVNARTITVAKMNLSTTDLNFKTQVIAIVSQVLNQYYGLAADYEDLKAKRNAAEVAQTFLADVNREVNIGSVAPTDLINAQAQAVISQQAVVDSEASLRQQEVALKNLLSRTGLTDPLLAGARVVPVDPLQIPAREELPPMEAMVKQALANRSDLAAEAANDKATEVSTLGTRNGVLPNLQVFGAETNAGLAGVPRTVVTNGQVETADRYFVGGIGTALGEVFRRNFPTNRIGAFYQGPLGNRQALADQAIDQLQLRQSQLNTRKDRNQVEVDVRNYVVALQQARSRYEAAVQNRQLQQQLLDAEQKRFRLGASIPYNVTLQQRDLITAQSAEVAALDSYSSARIALDQTLGTTLEVNHVSIGEARSGRVERRAVLPAVLPEAR
ncbi:MAG TPA: TolC family protein [Bryobacteraceae bacterium]|nr:TolC family protein [Bryobacteraceae bacterium]